MEIKIIKVKEPPAAHQICQHTPVTGQGVSRFRQIEEAAPKDARFALTSGQDIIILLCTGRATSS